MLVEDIGTLSQPNIDDMADIEGDEGNLIATETSLSFEEARAVPYGTVSTSLDADKSAQSTQMKSDGPKRPTLLSMLPPPKGT